MLWASTYVKMAAEWKQVSEQYVAQAKEIQKELSIGSNWKAAHNKSIQLVLDMNEMSAKAIPMLEEVRSRRIREEFEGGGFYNRDWDVAEKDLIDVLSVILECTTTLKIQE